MRLIMHSQEKWTQRRLNAKYCVQNPVRLGQSGLDNKVRKKDAFCIKVVHRNKTSEMNAIQTQKAYA